MITYDKVIDVKPHIKAFLMKKGHGFPSKFDFMDIIELDEKNYNREIFLYKKWLKKRPNPKHRVADFECLNEYGLICFDKYLRLFNARLTPKEQMERSNEGNTIL